MQFVTILICSVVLFLSAGTSRAGVDLPFETTYDCADWLQYTDALSCDGMSKWLNATDSCSNYEKIYQSANHDAGGGGKGQRHWEGPGSSGVNDNSGGINVSFNTLQPELWIRWYMRFESGYSYSTLIYNKLLYLWMRDGSGNSGSQTIVTWYGSDKFNLNAQAVQGGLNYSSADGKGWANTMGGTTGDGLWHLYEVHIKADTDGTDGIGEAWIDEVKIIDRTDLDWEGYAHIGWENVLIGSNQSTNNSSTCMAVDFDDVKINNTGYIGPIAGGGSPGNGKMFEGVSLSGASTQ